MEWGAFRSSSALTFKGPDKSPSEKKIGKIFTDGCLCVEQEDQMESSGRVQKPEEGVGSLGTESIDVSQ